MRNKIFSNPENPPLSPFEKKGEGDRVSPFEKADASKPSSCEKADAGKLSPFGKGGSRGIKFKLFSFDWKLAAGFGGLLLLIITIGFIGIQQIRGLAAMVAHLAKTDIPLQTSVLEMKTANSQFAMAVRSYIFWKNAKFLDAAAVAGKLESARLARQNFDRRLSAYASLARQSSQREWIQTIGEAEARIHKMGDNIIVLMDRMQDANPETKAGLQGVINKQLMDFENRIFEMDAFLDNFLQQFNLREIDKQLRLAQTQGRASVLFLSGALSVALGLGFQTAFLVYRRSRREKERRESLWRRVIRMEEEERNNLASQIHDQMGQDLSALKIFSGLIDQGLLPQDSEQKEKIGKVKKIVDSLMAKTHNISEMLKPPELDDVGLAESIAALVLRHKEMTAVHCDYERPPRDLPLSPEYNLVLYRLVQEGLTNIAKYAQAKNIQVVLKQKDDMIHLTIADDGVGFDYRAYLKQPSRRREDRLKLGLRGLRERIELLGGRMAVHTRPRQGTRLEVILPV